MRWSKREYPVLYGSFHMDKFTTVDEASQKHDSMTRFETAAEEGEYENYLPSHAFVLTVETMDDAF